MNVVGFGYAARAKPPSSDELAEHWAPLVDHCIECFGVGRCMFASNFPVDKVGGTERQGAGCRVQCHTLQLTPLRTLVPCSCCATLTLAPARQVSCSYNTCFNAFKKIVRQRDLAAKTALFHDNAERVYRLDRATIHPIQKR
jgi:predicted TIM-barrel fold metal-dependent hydrolase